MGDVVGNVDGQRRDLGLDRFHRRLRGVPALSLVTGQGRECNFDICAGKPESAPTKQETSELVTPTHHTFIKWHFENGNQCK